MTGRGRLCAHLEEEHPKLKESRRKTLGLGGIWSNVGRVGKPGQAPGGWGLTGQVRCVAFVPVGGSRSAVVDSSPEMSPA